VGIIKVMFVLLYMYVAFAVAIVYS